MAKKVIVITILRTEVYFTFELWATKVCLSMGSLVWSRSVLVTILLFQICISLWNSNNKNCNIAITLRYKLVINMVIRVSQNLTFDPDYDLQLTFCPLRGQNHPKKFSEKLVLVWYKCLVVPGGQLVNWRLGSKKSCVYWDTLMVITWSHKISILWIFTLNSLSDVLCLRSFPEHDFNHDGLPSICASGNTF